MTQFIQLHLLTAYPPANLNRDDTGRPKTAVMGGCERLRISSQALKRAWRASPDFARLLQGHLAIRTRRFGEKLVESLVNKTHLNKDQAEEKVKKIAEHLGKLETEKGKNPVHLKQLVFLSPEEMELAEKVALMLADDDKDVKASDILLKNTKAADIAMFGRMLADLPEFNREAAVQVSHALTTHKVIVEDDFYTAVDDLKDTASADDAGAGFMGVQEFASGVFYLYICINRNLLVKNLDGDEEIAKLALEALIRAAATIAPSGKQNSFAAHARALYILAEKGSQQPRSLAPAFLKPVGQQGDQIDQSINKLVDFRERLNTAYGACCDGDPEIMNCLAEPVQGSLSGIVAFVTS